jgi:hypothetical protein
MTSRYRYLFSNTSASFESALKELVMVLQGDIEEIKERRKAMKARLDEAAAVHGIDPAAVRRLLKQRKGDINDINCARKEEIDETYRTIVDGGAPTIPQRSDTELDKVMSLVTGNKPPKIDDIMKAISCSRGKAHKLRTLAAARLASKSSCSSKSRELELSSHADTHPSQEGRLAEVAVELHP